MTGTAEKLHFEESTRCFEFESCETRKTFNSFGNALDELRTVDLVELTACSIFDDFQVDIEAFAVDEICSKIQSQDLMKVQEYHTYLSGLNLADQMMKMAWKLTYS